MFITIQIGKYQRVLIYRVLDLYHIIVLTYMIYYLFKLYKTVGSLNAALILSVSFKCFMYTFCCKMVKELSSWFSEEFMSHSFSLNLI